MLLFQVSYYCIAYKTQHDPSKSYKGKPLAGVGLQLRDLVHNCLGGKQDGTQENTVRGSIWDVKWMFLLWCLKNRSPNTTVLSSYHWTELLFSAPLEINLVVKICSWMTMLQIQEPFSNLSYVALSCEWTLILEGNTEHCFATGLWGFTVWIRMMPQEEQKLW